MAGSTGCRTPNTISNMFPYAEPYGRPYIRELNYMRNTVKVVMDAYDGTVQFYVWGRPRSDYSDLPQHLPGAFQGQE